MPKIDALETGSSAQRNSLNHQAIEDYLKTIFSLAEQADDGSWQIRWHVVNGRPAAMD